MALATTVTALTTTATKRVGCCCFAHVRSSTKGTGSWDKHRVVWDITSYPAGFVYTTTDPRPGAQNGTTLNLRDGDFEGYNFGFHATHAGTYTVRATITDAAGVTSSDTADFVVSATSSTVTLDAGGGGDYTTWAALHSGESLGTDFDAALTVNVSSGTYDVVWGVSSQQLVAASSVHFAWDGVGSKPVINGDDGILDLRGENITFDGIEFTLDATDPARTFDVDDGSNIGFVDVRFGEWGGAACLNAAGASGPDGILVLNSTGDGKKSTETTGAEFWHGDLTTSDVAFVGLSIVAPAHNYRLIYELGTVGFTLLACNFQHDTSKSGSSRQCVRFRKTTWVYAHRCRIRDGMTVQSQETNAPSNIRIHAIFMEVNEDTYGGGFTHVTVDDSVVSSVGVYASILDTRGSIESTNRKLGTIEISTVTASDITFASITNIEGGGSQSNPTAIDAGASVAANYLGILVVDGGGDTSWTFFEDQASYAGSVTDCVFPSQSGLVAASSFYLHQEGDTDALATFNGYANVSGCQEVDTSIDSAYLPDVLTTIDTPAGVHTDYYGNALGSTSPAGAVSAIPATTNYLPISVGGSFLLIGS